MPASQNQDEPSGPDAASHTNFRAAPGNIEKEWRAASGLQPELGFGGKIETSRHNRPDMDPARKPGIYGVVASPSSASLAPTPAIMTTLPGPAPDVHSPKSSNSNRTPDQRSTDVNKPLFALKPAFPSGPPQRSRASLSSSEDTNRDLSGYPREDINHSAMLSDGFSAMQWPQGQDMVVSTLKFSQGQQLGPLDRIAEPALPIANSQPCHSSRSVERSSIENSNDYSTSDVPVTGPGLHVFGLSPASSSSTDVTEDTESEYTSSESELGPASSAIDPLTRQLLAILMAGWLWNSIALDLHKLAEDCRKCPPDSSTGQVGRRAGKRPEKKSASQSSGSSKHEGPVDDSDHEDEDDDESREGRWNNRMVEGSPGEPRLLACPFNKMDPMRYSALNQREVEYRNCSSGHWTTIPRLK
jgi:hypothetical protein